MKKNIFHVASVCTFMLFSSNINADSLIDFTLDVEYQPYSVIGGTSEEIDSYFDNEKPFFLKNVNLDAYTSWKYDIKYDDESCNIESYNVKILYTLPQIQSTDNHSQIFEDFSFYLNQLYRHEETHCAISVKLFQNIYTALKKGQSGNCKKQLLIIDNLEMQIKKQNELFDVYTNHGEIELEISPFSESEFYPVCKINIPKYKY